MAIKLIPLSGAVAVGRMLPVASTISPGTLVHTSDIATAALDKVFIFVSNITTLDATLTLEWGGASPTADRMMTNITVPANSAPQLVVPGLLLAGGLWVKAIGGTANALNLSGYVHRFT